MNIHKSNFIKRVDNQNLIRPIILGLLFLISFESCAQDNTSQKFQEHFKLPNKNLSVKGIDTFKGIMRIYTPITENDTINRVFLLDRMKNLEDSNKLDATISYEIKTLTSNFISAMKVIYVEDSGSPRGFFIWNEGINYYIYDGVIYSVEYEYKGDVKLLLNEAIMKNSMDNDCLKSEIKNKADFTYFIKEQTVYIANPLESPFCDVEIPIYNNAVSFKFSKFKNVK